MSEASPLSYEAMRKAAVMLVTGSTVLHEEAGVESGVLVPHTGMGVQLITNLKVTSAKLRLIRTPMADATLALTVHTPESTPSSSTHVGMADGSSRPSQHNRCRP